VAKAVGETDGDGRSRDHAADRWPSAAQLAKADVIVFYSNNPD
jgi:hypothetical protein